MANTTYADEMTLRLRDLYRMVERQRRALRVLLDAYGRISSCPRCGTLVWAVPNPRTARDTVFDLDGLHSGCPAKRKEKRPHGNGNAHHARA